MCCLCECLDVIEYWVVVIIFFFILSLSFFLSLYLKKRKYLSDKECGIALMVQVKCIINVILQHICAVHRSTRAQFQKTRGKMLHHFMHNMQIIFFFKAKACQSYFLNASSNAFPFLHFKSIGSRCTFYYSILPIISFCRSAVVVVFVLFVFPAYSKICCLRIKLL